MKRANSSLPIADVRRVPTGSRSWRNAAQAMPPAPGQPEEPEDEYLEPEATYEEPAYEEPRPRPSVSQHERRQAEAKPEPRPSEPTKLSQAVRLMSRGQRVIAFIEEFCRVPEGKLVGQRIKLDDFQKRFILDIYDNPKAVTHTAILSMARKNGKALALDTPIPSPSGLTTMGDLKVGDVIYGSDGQPTRVKMVTPVMNHHTCYRVRFSDGEEIVADAEHQWSVRWPGRRGKPDELRTVTTHDMVHGPLPPGASSLTYPWSVPVNGKVRGEETALPIPPYTLGVWLGDGNSDGAQLSLADRDLGTILPQLQDEGWPCRPVDGGPGSTIVVLNDGIRNRAKTWCPLHDLRSAGLLHNKHIPEEYFTASVEQRKALLRGLMDTDGTVYDRGNCVYGSTSWQLAQSVQCLVAGLGFKTSIRVQRAVLNGKDYGPFYEVSFYAGQEDELVSVPFKRDKLPALRPDGSRCKWKAVVSIELVDSVPVRCIQVEAEDSCYLCGWNYTVTHNTAIIGCLVIVHTCGPEAQQNSQIISGAMSREQAALVFNYASKMIALDKRLSAVCRIVPSHKQIFGIARNVEYRAISAEATTAYGLSPVLAILDEMGQIVGPVSPFVEAITTSQGAHEHPLLIVISTSAASDADMLSLWIDDALRGDDPGIIVHEYKADANCDLMDEEQWRKANPGLGTIRSIEDLRKQCRKAVRLPALENSVRNLLLNQRVALVSKWLAPTPWKNCGGDIDIEVFQGDYAVSLGIDLSSRLDLTAAVFSATDDCGVTHQLCYAFTPQDGIRERAERDRAPYELWVKQGYLLATPGRTVDYDWVAQYLKQECVRLGITINILSFDRWKIEQFRKAAGAIEFASEAEWKEVGQGYKDMDPRMTSYEALVLNGKLRHGSNPVLNMAAANAICNMDPAGNKKLDKAKATQKIDPIQAAVMSAFDVAEGAEADVDLAGMIA